MEATQARLQDCELSLAAAYYMHRSDVMEVAGALGLGAGACRAKIPVVRAQTKTPVLETAFAFELAALGAQLADELAVAKAMYVFPAQETTPVVEAKAMDTEVQATQRPVAETATVQVAAKTEAVRVVEKTVDVVPSVASTKEDTAGSEEAVVAIEAAETPKPIETTAAPLASDVEVLTASEPPKSLSTTETSMAVDEVKFTAKSVTDDESETHSELAESVVNEASDKNDAEPEAEIEEDTATAAAASEALAPKSTAGDESEETLPGASESAVSDEEPEIGEYMVIDAAVASKSTAAKDGEATSFGFIPMPLRSSGYVASSVVLAVATVVVAALASRK
ncbi:hypothetical protein BBJ28_00006057 [Nothophytophthora sp. Chile5]|nr:hypothetical protein BBJ28_00006057 [Nothophytophthora sp. Chile5]